MFRTAASHSALNSVFVQPFKLFKEILLRFHLMSLPSSEMRSVSSKKRPLVSEETHVFKADGSCSCWYVDAIVEEFCDASAVPCHSVILIIDEFLGSVQILNVLRLLLFHSSDLHCSSLTRYVACLCAVRTAFSFVHVRKVYEHLTHKERELGSFQEHPRSTGCWPCVRKNPSSCSQSVCLWISCLFCKRETRSVPHSAAFCAE